MSVAASLLLVVVRRSAYSVTMRLQNAYCRFCATLAVCLALLLPALAESDALGEAHHACENGDYGAALKEFNRGVGEGFAEAAYWLDLLYDWGHGVGRDPRTAYQWFSEAAEQGHGETQRVIGVCLELGKALKQDFVQAAVWCGHPVWRNNVKAMRNLVYMYYFGSGVTREHAKAASLFRSAAALGSDDARYDLGFVHYNGDGIPRDLPLAVHYLGQEAEGGNGDAQLMLSPMYLLGEGVEIDFPKAFFSTLLGAV